ncbi:hypothetical protein [Lacipirellula limnantheis]|uniref:Uncharacterized protein n=1 Tax=Lacipirellula limnantheis TaxID=2528024 RepID=A0A517U5V7_9BACT|nr:hypothetical protein [Lacipirellula limnantheis]QDT75950.1 hypothetical protein I41_51950 [Lacipirellula limnantheis]
MEGMSNKSPPSFAIATARKLPKERGIDIADGSPRLVDSGDYWEIGFDHPEGMTGDCSPIFVRVEHATGKAHVT